MALTEFVLKSKIHKTDALSTTLHGSLGTGLVCLGEETPVYILMLGGRHW